ncbi:cytochrome P450 [Flagelloscypha sp. PMI_526]|nr:cytochrome P450 [Flagelloscypha sp. PMI_526]
MAFPSSLVLNAFLVTTIYALYRAIKKSKTLPYPPGPPGRWLFGNINDVPTQKQWIAYKEMSQNLGSPMVHLNMLGMHIIVINELATANEIFEKRSAKYSDRPRLPMMNEVAGFGWNFGFRGSDEQWKTCRRHFDAYFRESEARKLRPLELAATHTLLHRLLENPDDFSRHFRFHSSKLILGLGYGIDVKANDDYYIQVAETALDVLNQTAEQNIVDVLPWTQHLPGWLPGMGWKRRTVGWKERSLAMRDEPFDAVKNGISTNSCMASKLLDEVAEHSADETIARSTTGTLFSAGTHTMFASLNFMVLVMLVFPQVQNKAQEELDRVVGKDRLPGFEDKKNLPYLQAICQELLRWTSLVPLALPHRAMEDDVWVSPNGTQYLIPKGAIMIGNSWAMLRDPAVYPDPDEFKPDRFLTKDGAALDSSVPLPDVAFGYGARICAGRWAAEDILFISIASILSAFRIEPTSKGQTWKNNFDELVVPSLVMEPHPFKCTISPRHQNTDSLIRDAEFHT